MKKIFYSFIVIQFIGCTSYPKKEEVSTLINDYLPKILTIGPRIEIPNESSYNILEANNRGGLSVGLDVSRNLIEFHDDMINVLTATGIATIQYDRNGGKYIFYNDAFKKFISSGMVKNTFTPFMDNPVDLTTFFPKALTRQSHLT